MLPPSTVCMPISTTPKNACSGKDAKTIPSLASDGMGRGVGSTPMTTQ